MKYLEMTFAEPASNLACDEALLEMFEAERLGDGLLRIWQPNNYFVVLGHSNSMNTETNMLSCTTAGIPILRRVSGGGAVLQGPGCLNYSLILDCEAHPVRNVSSAFDYVMERHRQWVSAATGVEVCVGGVSDLTVNGRKFSGNAQYRKAHYVLVHGTFLVDFDITLMDRYLRLPAKQPAYRQNRPHLEFVSNLRVESRRLRRSLKEGWEASGDRTEVPLDRVQALVRCRYGRVEWSNKF